MLATKPVGRHASTLKYDILSALSAHALSCDKHIQRLILRLTVLITTRYNWRTNELSIGRQEIARLWSVNERTVKRELGKLRASGWMTVKRPGARGRVTVYELNLGGILADTQPVWPLLGPDFVQRLGSRQNPVSAQDSPSDSNVIPFHATAEQRDDGDDDIWMRVQQMLHQRDPELWSSWFRHLSPAPSDHQTTILRAPSRFMADYIGTHLLRHLTTAYLQIEPNMGKIKVISADS
ncbi:MAG: DnaA N-terminal domain-containing protein [Pseudomonadota bacterium]